MKEKIIAIIPARGGSKGIPGKNLIPINGKPLIEWSINHALSSSLIDEVWVSSDSQEILKFSESIGAKTITRPLEISGDSASSESAWIDAIMQIQTMDKNIGLVVGMQATSPIRNKKDIDNAIAQYRKEKLNSLFSGNILDDMNYWSINNGNNLYSVNYDYQNRKRRQELQEKFLENGSFYLFTPEGMLSNNNRLHGKIGCYLMAKKTMFQIDEIEDMEICEAIMKFKC
jgi:CMP-N,N'-diacetyllegionaminic acid synthase